MFEVIGTLYDGDRKANPPTFTPISGFHVNCLPEDLTPELEPYVVEPKNKRAIFAGLHEETVCLKFADEAEFMSLSLVSE